MPKRFWALNFMLNSRTLGFFSSALAVLAVNYVRGSDFDSHLWHPDAFSVVKNIVLTGFGKITLLDLDTIDLSNLNRQFLFRKKDVKQSKALVRLFAQLYTNCALV